MKFENPIMNIAMFEVTDIVTTSGETETATVTAAKTALTQAGVKATTDILQFKVD